MSEDKPESTDEEQSDEGAPKGAARGHVNPLSKPTDYSDRPGFRSPSNTRSKADKKKKRKKR